MQATPMFLGACAFASFAGAIGGAAINTQPIQRASIGSDQIHRAAIAFDPSDTEFAQAAPADQYAMTTPEGRIEIAELSSRGLYAQRRYGWREASFDYPPEQTHAEPAYDDAGYAAPAIEPVEAPDAGNAEPVLALAQPAALAVNTGGGAPKVIDVAASLAARN